MIVGINVRCTHGCKIQRRRLEVVRHEEKHVPQGLREQVGFLVEGWEITIRTILVCILTVIEERWTASGLILEQSQYRRWVGSEGKKPVMVRQDGVSDAGMTRCTIPDPWLSPHTTCSSQMFLKLSLGHNSSDNKTPHTFTHSRFAKKRNRTWEDPPDV